MIKRRNLSCSSYFLKKNPNLKIQENPSFQNMLSGMRMSSTWPLSQAGFVVSFKIPLRSLCVLMLLTVIIETKCFLLKTTLPIPTGFLFSKEKSLNEVFLWANSSNKCMSWEQENYERLLLPCFQGLPFKTTCSL